MTDEPFNEDDIQIEEPKPERKPSKKKVLHEAVDIEGWVKSLNMNEVGETLAQELTVRGLVEPADFKKPGAMRQIAASLQKALNIDAIKIANNYLKEEDDG